MYIYLIMFIYAYTYHLLSCIIWSIAHEVLQRCAMWKNHQDNLGGMMVSPSKSAVDVRVSLRIL